MATIIQRNFTGICPVTNQETTITVDLVERAPAGREKTYVKTHFSCPNGNCSVVKDCSIYNNIPIEF